MNRIITFLFLFSFLFVACKDDPKSGEVTITKKRKQVKTQRFNSDNAYQFIKDQIAFGPRVPNTEGHVKCKNWLVEKFKGYGAEVIEQDTRMEAHTKEVYELTNIIAQYNLGESERIVLMAHWDTREVAEKDPDESRRDEPIDGADDGGSGVAVLLEIARHLQMNPIELGVDIVLFDGEDNGMSNASNQKEIKTWCLGSQYWSANPHRENYTAMFGILLDMVGAKDAQFTKERASRTYAGNILNKVWNLAKRMKQDKYFIDVNTSEVLDDHSFVNEIARIPTIDIINHPHNTGKTFGEHHHTHQDNIDIIDKETLTAAGQVVLAVVYQTNNGTF